MATPAQYATTRPITHGTGTTASGTTATAAAWTLPRALLVAAPALVFLGIGLMTEWDLAMLASEPFFLVMWGIGVPFAVVLALKDRAWVYLTQGILASLMPLMITVMFGWHEILSPLSGLPSLGTFLFAVVVLVTLPTAIVAFRRVRKGVAFPSLGQAFRSRHTTYTIAFAALFLGFALSGTLASNQARDAVSGGYDFDIAKIGGAEVAVPIHEFQFLERTVTVTADQPTGIVVENRDPTEHTFTYEVNGVEFDHKVLPGTTVSFLVLFEETGQILFRCLPHSTEYSDDVSDKNDAMTGVINVVA